MAKLIIQYTFLFIVLLLLQIVIFNHVCIFNIAIPFVFIYFILRLPLSCNINLLITLSFLLGLSVDIFSDTQGMNALACTILSVARRPVYSLYVPREEDNENIIPSIRDIGLGAFMKYALTLTFLYCCLICIIQAFSFFDFKMLIFRILGSTILTFLIILGIESLTNSGSAKRL